VPAKAPASVAIPIGGPAGEPSAIPRAPKVTAGIATGNVAACVPTGNVAACVPTGNVAACVPTSAISCNRGDMPSNVTAAIATEAALGRVVPSTGETRVASESTSRKSAVTPRKSAMAAAH
jgi:hypothetical protein